MIILITVIVVVIALVYYFYKKMQSQEETILSLTQKCENLELMFRPIAPLSDLENVYNREPNHTPRNINSSELENDSTNSSELENDSTEIQTPTFQKQVKSRCGEMCSLEPLRFKANFKEMNDIVDLELNNIKKASRRSSRRTSPKTP